MSPGLETTIAIFATVRTRLAKPYSNCTDKVYHFPNISDVTYTMDLCSDACSQDKIIEACDCLWGGAQSTFEQASLVITSPSAVTLPCTRLIIQ